MKIINVIALLACSFIATNTHAATITNGDFATGDFSGWSKDTDGFGDISTLNDFSIVGGSAQIEVDAFDPPGNVFGSPLDEVFFANTLFQGLDFTAASTSTFLLSLDFAVNSEITSLDTRFIADFFLIGLNDGAGTYFDGNGAAGFLVDPTDIDGAFSYTLDFSLDNSFANQTGWFLDFQLAPGLDNSFFPDAFASTFLLHSASLTEIAAPVVPGPQPVSEPASALIFSFALAGLFMQRRKRAN